MFPYKRLLRPLLFSLPPEHAHQLGEFALRMKYLWSPLAPYYKPRDPALKTSLAGIQMDSPVGVAAGCDKNCRFLNSLMNLGFGYVVGGTVTLHPRPGNPGPRLLRNRTQGSLTNSLGFPSHGANAVMRNLNNTAAKPLIISISGLNLKEFVQCYQRISPSVDGVELNISSPNTAGLRVFQDRKTFSELLEGINTRRTKPLFMKIPPYTGERDQDKVLNLVRIAKRMGVDGITAANTRPVDDPALKVGKGGLSGKPLFQDMLRILVDVRKEVGDAMAITACGGISKPEDVLEALSRGADTVQIYTGLIYEGPSVARQINQGLSRFLKDHNLASIKDLRGFGNPSDSRSGVSAI